MAKNEQTYAPAPSDSNGPPFRLINVPPDGTQDPTIPAPDMEVVVLADSGGNITDDFRASRRRDEMNVLTLQDSRNMAMAMHANDRIGLIDRRGNIDRGTIR